MARTKNKSPRVPGAYRGNGGTGRKAAGARPPARRRGFLRRRSLLIPGAAAAVALALVAASLLSARGGSDSPAPATPSPGAEVFGADVVQSLLGGIPQDGTALGAPDAPVTLVEYADLQCPFCAEWAARTLPELVEDYVRAGELRIELRGMAFIGEESDVALRAVLAAGEQNRLWNVLDLLYLNQGGENGGWVTDDLLAAVGRSVPGLDGAAMLEAMSSDAVGDMLAQHAGLAEAVGVASTPSFELGPTGGELAPLAVTSLEPDEFRAAIDELLAR